MTEVPHGLRRSSAGTTASRTAADLGSGALAAARAVRVRKVVVRLLADAGYRITAQRRLANNLAWQLRLATGQVVNVYDTGALVVQGVGREPVNRLLQRFTAAEPA